MNDAQQLTNMLTIILVVMLFIFMTLGAILIFIRIKQKNAQKKEIPLDSNKKPESDVKKIAKEYSKESIFKFMEFNKIEDNMIIQKNGNRFLMVIECQGVNYDLMSENEKISVEEGFLQFLNTLRHPIQIYIQTRTVNLNDSIENYTKKVEEIEIELEKRKMQYQQNVNSGRFTQEQLSQQFYELTKQTNLYEYGKDIIANTERMSLNKNVLNKKYYIIIPYYSEEIGEGSFDKEEIKNLAFSELYTKAQSLIRTLSGCEVSGKVMNSTQLVDLLYTAYNRDEAEVFSVDRAVRAGYNELYTTAPDVLDKKMRKIDEKIEEKALEMINNSVLEARNAKEQEIYEKEMQFARLVQERAEMILNQNESYLGKDIVDSAKEIIKRKRNTKKEKEVVEGQIEIKEEAPKKTRKPRAKKEKSEEETSKEKVTKEKGGKKDVGQEKQTKTRKSKASK
mgnify:CR=1 FL=1